MEPAGRRNPDSPVPRDEEDVRRLIRCLQSLVEGQSAIAELVACGPKAIPALRDFLLSGRIVSVPQPRIWAVEALAGLRAKEVLVEYLQAPTRSADAQLLFAEEAVRNTAARRLGAWRDDRTFAILLDLCRKRNLPGAVEALAEFQRAEAIPCLDRALEDSLCQTAAEEGFRKLGTKARGALLLSAVTPLPSAGEETPSSLCRRRSVLALLTELGVERPGWTELRPLLMEPDPEILVRTAKLAAAVADPAGRSAVAARLVDVLAGVPWYIAKEAEWALLALAPESRPAIAAELRRRFSRPPRERAGDEVLRLLLRLEASLRNVS